MSDANPIFRHSRLDRLFGRHQWRLSDSSYYYFRAGGDAMFEYDCPCGALRQQRWHGEHAEGRRLTDDERKALGPYL